MASCNGGSNGYTLTLNYNQASQNVAGNYSTVNWELVFSCGQYYYQNSSTIDNFKAWVNGTCVYNQNRAISFPGQNRSIVIASGSINVGHNADGTKTISTSASFSPGKSASYYPGAISCSGALTLSTIPRASVIGTVSFSNFWSAFRVSYTKYYSGFTCKLRVSIPQVEMLQTFTSYASNASVAFSSSVQYTIMTKLISGSIKLGFVIETWSGSTKIGESTESVITISRPAINTISSLPNFNVDSGVEIRLGRSYPSYISKLDITLSGTNIYSSNISDSQKITFSSSQLAKIYSLMAKTNSATFTFKVTSYYGSTAVGSTSKNVVGTITGATPSFGGFSWETINNLTLHDNQTIIKSKSNVKVTIKQATAYKGASIAYYQVTIGNVTSKVTSLSATLNNVDSNIITVYAVDSRGNAVSKQMSCSKYINYTAPTITALNYSRGSGGIGADVTIDFNGSVFVGNFGLQSNTITATYFYKDTSAKDYTQGTSDINPALATKYGKTVAIRGDLGANGFSITKNFNLKIIIKDKLSSYTKEIVIAKGTPAMSIHEDGVAFGDFYNTKIGSTLQSTDISVGGNKVLGVLGYKYGLGANVNLNSVTVEGYYQQSSNANTSTSLNYPVAEAGLLTVVNRSYIYQTYQTYNGSGFYFRSYYTGNSTWSAWREVAIEGSDASFNSASFNSATITNATLGGRTYRPKWVLLKAVAGSTAATTTISNIGTYNEVLITIGPQNESHRILASTIVPIDVFLSTASHASQGTHQAYYSSSIFGGWSYRGSNQITGQACASTVVTRIYGR